MAKSKYQNKQSVSRDNKFDRNPRVITKKQFALLKDHLETLGDLSGVVFCHNHQCYVGGNQRSEVFDGAEIEIVERYDEPTEKHTLAYGFIKHNGEKYAYREVRLLKRERVLGRSNYKIRFRKQRQIHWLREKDYQKI